MITIIASTDFVGQNNVPDKDIVGTDLQFNYIEKYEPIFLTELLGATLYGLLKDDLEAEDHAERFTNLIPYLKPAIVDYVYWYWLQGQSIVNLGTGAGQSKKQNAVTASPWPLMVRAWNEMVDLNKKTNKFLKDNATIYPEYTIVLPTWYFCGGLYPFFDWNWYSWYGCYELPKIYRLQNGLGI